MTPRKPLTKTLQVLSLVMAGLYVGVSLPTFSGTFYAWAALIAFTLVLILNSYQLIYDFWRP